MIATKKKTLSNPQQVALHYLTTMPGTNRKFWQAMDKTRMKAIISELLESKNVEEATKKKLRLIPL